MPVSFKRGVYHFNEERNFDFQLNRIIMWDGGRIEDIVPISQKIHNSETWKTELIKLGEQAEEEGRTENAIAYYRMSEFFMYDGDPDKKKYYKKATDMFYEFYREYFTNGTVEQFQVSYEEVKLPVMHVKPVGERKDIILLHGGNDSYYEEFFFPMLYLAENGFEVYLFEGPGQGGVMRLQGKHFTHEWEKPVKAILDYFHLEDVTIIGASLGGMLAPRAAAFEKRISRVIAWSVFPNFQEVILGGPTIEDKKQMKLAQFCIRFRLKGLINIAMEKAAKKSEVIRWGLRHGMYAYEADSAYDYALKMDRYQMIDVADQITQDVLIAGASKDHFIDYKTVSEEIDALTNVRSLTFRLFTEKEDACNHCNCGNVKLTFDTFMNWIMQMKANNR